MIRIDEFEWEQVIFEINFVMDFKLETKLIICRVFGLRDGVVEKFLSTKPDKNMMFCNQSIIPVLFKKYLNLNEFY